MKLAGQKSFHVFMPKSRIYNFIINNVLSVFHYFTFALTLQRTVAGDQRTTTITSNVCSEIVISLLLK